MRKKVFEWIKRYLPAEIFAYIGAFGAGFFAKAVFDTPLVVAFFATWAENLFYYGKIVFSEIKILKQKNLPINLSTIIKLLRNIILEFGVGEYLDSFVFRPLLMYWVPLQFTNFALGLLIAKISADIIFYIPTIIFYELRKIIFE
jgi:hypothetical protein